jgi:predicted nuclease with RNAse H fold
VRTLGIDLAAKDPKTAACLLDWSSGRATVERLDENQSDAALRDLAKEATWIGIDVPFGWPAAAMEAIAAYGDRGRWSSKATTPELAFRKTDLLVRERAGLWPLSVSSDRIAVTAWRGARLLTLLAGRSKIDRIGSKGVVEVYPAAALKLWGFDRRGYKTSGRRASRETEVQKRRELLQAIEKRALEAGWLRKLPGRVRAQCEQSDDALDAFVCALIARAAGIGQTAWPEPELAEAARIEGWIHLPLPMSFERLGGRPE